MKDDLIQRLVEGTIKKVIAGRLSMSGAVDVLLAEMGRGGRMIVFDERLWKLEQEVSRMGFTTYLIATRSESGETIMPQLKSRIFVTRDGKRFVDGVAKHRFGLIWIISRLSNKELAEKIKQVKSTFTLKPAQVVKV
jgi:hypothetical protein